MAKSYTQHAQFHGMIKLQGSIISSSLTEQDRYNIQAKQFAVSNNMD